MISSWRFVEFSLNDPEDLSIDLDSSVLSNQNSEVSIYHADEGKKAYELVIVHAKKFDYEEITRIIEVAFDANRRLFVLFHKRHYKLLNDLVYNIFQIPLTPLGGEGVLEDKLITKFTNEIKSSASKILNEQQIILGVIYGLTSKDRPKIRNEHVYPSGYDGQSISSSPIEEHQDVKPELEMREQTMSDLEASIVRKLENITLTPNSEIDNEVLLPREVLIYGWLLQRQWGKIPWSDLIRLIGESLNGNVRQFIRDHNRYFVTPPQANMENLAFSEDMMVAIEKVFGSPDYHNILSHVPFFPEGVTGSHLVKYFVKLANPLLPLPDMICEAFTSALGNIRITTINRENDIYRISNSTKWSFIFGVKSTDKSALTERDFYRYVAFLMGYCEANEHALLLAPNSENIAISRDSASFPRLHHVWSMSVVRFFNLLDHVVKDSKRQTVTDQFTAIFPPAGETFSASDSCKRLRNACGIQGSS